MEELTLNNLEALTQLMLALWPECDYQEELENNRRILDVANETGFLVKDGDRYIAFILLSLRQDYVEGTHSSPVAYIEGLYVDPAYRKTGIARSLVDRGAHWGLEMGATEYASDTELRNNQSISFHIKVGFREANRVVCFVKSLA